MEVGQRASGSELTDSLGEPVRRVVQLRQYLHEIQSIADPRHAKVLQVRLEQQEDDVALQLVLNEGGGVLAETERAKPNAKAKTTRARDTRTRWR